MKSGRKNLKMEKSTKMRYRGIMFEIDRTDFQILTAFKVVDEETVIILDKPTDGITIVDDIVYIQRGYERFEEKLRSIGGLIEKVETEREIQKFKLKVG